MKQRFVFALFLAAAAPLSAAESTAAIRWSPPGVVVVNVVNRDLAGVPGAAVTLRRADSPAGAPAAASATTNAGGHVEFRDVAEGTYFVRVERTGFLAVDVGPATVDTKTPPAVRLPEILVVVNPVLSF
jgi:Carboxypeptidase regulatory-like domain